MLGHMKQKMTTVGLEPVTFAGKPFIAGVTGALIAGRHHIRLFITKKGTTVLQVAVMERGKKNVVEKGLCSQVCVKNIYSSHNCFHSRMCVKDLELDS